MKIRELKPNDLEKWINLVERADNRNKEWALRKFESFVLNKCSKKLLVVQERNKLVGFAGIKAEAKEKGIPKEINQNFMFLTWIAFLPEFRARGYGSKLLKKAEKYAFKWNKKGIFLGCRDEVIPFYERNGYKKQGNFINEQGKIENLMILRLNNIKKHNPLSKQTKDMLGLEK